MSESDQIREGAITMVATGDCMITRSISAYKGMESIQELFRNADVRFTNCETVFHRCESYPMRAGGIGTKMYAEPTVAKDLKWLGLNLASVCNNHILDYGPHGMFSTIRALEENGIVNAGAGRDLDEAREPRYLETPNGRVALVAACYFESQEPWERASNMNAGIPARPGLNLLKVKFTHVVTVEEFKVIKQLTAELGLDPPEGREKNKGEENNLSFLGRWFTIGEKPETVVTIRKQDFEDTIRTIEDARRTADWVIMSFHSHSIDAKGGEYPAEFVKKYARACIDAGADAYFGTGAHVIQGMEVYRNKPIFYGLGNLIVQDEIVNKVTFDQYEAKELGRDAKPSDLFRIRHGTIPPTGFPYARWWFETVIPLFELDDGGIRWLKAYPVMMEFDRKSLVQRGRPHIDRSSNGRVVLDRFQKLSTILGTQLSVGDEFAFIKN